jgi:hypothetical protein
MACNIARSPNQASQAASGSAELHCHRDLPNGFPQSSNAPPSVARRAKQATTTMTCSPRALSWDTSKNAPPRRKPRCGFGPWPTGTTRTARRRMATQPRARRPWPTSRRAGGGSRSRDGWIVSPARRHGARWPQSKPATLARFNNSGPTGHSAAGYTRATISSSTAMILAP